MKVLVVDPGNSGRDGWHEIYGNSDDALNGNISRVFLTGVPQSVPTTKCRQPDGWSCGPYSLAECLGQASGENARSWLLARGMITSTYGTEYSGIVGYLGACGYSCSYDGRAHDGEMNGAIFDKIIDHMRKGYKVILCMHGTSKGCRTNYWTRSGHYITLYAIEGGSGKIDVDGLWGQQTTRKAQQVLKTTIDGIVSNQNAAMKGNLPNCKPESWEFVDPKKLRDGSELVRAIQRLIGATPDGFFGVQSAGLFQKFLGVKVDGYVGAQTVKAWQTWLNSR